MATNTLYDLKFAGNPTTNAARLKTLAHGGPLVVAMDHALASFSYDPPARPCKFVLLRSVTEVHVDLYAERLRDGWANRYGAVSGTSARKINAKIRSSSRYCERELIYTLHGHLARS